MCVISPWSCLFIPICKSSKKEEKGRILKTWLICSVEFKIEREREMSMSLPWRVNCKISTWGRSSEFLFLTCSVWVYEEVKALFNQDLIMGQRTEIMPEINGEENRNQISDAQWSPVFPRGKTKIVTKKKNCQGMKRHKRHPDWKGRRKTMTACRRHDFVY